MCVSLDYTSCIQIVCVFHGCLLHYGTPALDHTACVLTPTPYTEVLYICICFTFTSCSPLLHPVLYISLILCIFAGTSFNYNCNFLYIAATYFLHFTATSCASLLPFQYPFHLKRPRQIKWLSKLVRNYRSTVRLTATHHPLLNGRVSIRIQAIIWSIRTGLLYFRLQSGMTVDSTLVQFSLQ